MRASENRRWMKRKLPFNPDFCFIFLLSNHRSSGKKATPPTAKANAASGGKAPPRAGTRSSARLSREILAPESNSKTSPGQRETRKRPPTGSRPISTQRDLPKHQRLKRCRLKPVNTNLLTLPPQKWLLRLRNLPKDLPSPRLHPAAAPPAGATAFTSCRPASS